MVIYVIYLLYSWILIFLSLCGAEFLKSEIWKSSDIYFVERIYACNM